MNINAGKKTIAAVKNENHFYKVIVAVFGLSNLLLCAVLGYVLFRDNVIIVPPVVREEYAIGAETSQKYLVDMAEYVVTTLRTINKDNVDYNNKIILKMVEGDTLPSLRKTLDAQAVRIKKEDITTVWSGSTAEPSIVGKNTVILSGRLRTYYSDKLVSNESKEYKVEFGLSGLGKIYVKKVEEVKPDVEPISAGS